MIRLRMLLLLLASSLVLSGCGGFDVYKLPLPGGPDAGDDPMTVEVKFADVLDLVPRSTVKVNDVSVGQVTDVALEGTHARVVLELRNDVKLPDNAVAEIRQTSLLGEKFVSLAAPEDGRSTGLLRTGDVIPLERAGRNPEVEEVLGALSLLLNGGGLPQLRTINQELGTALEGREDSARSVLTQIRVLMTQLDDNKTDIVDAIDSLNTLAVDVRKQQGSIDLALEELPSALRSINTQRDDLVRMLRALERLSGVGVRVINASKDSTIATFRQLRPVLKGFADSGDDFAKAFNVFLTYPFVDEVVGRDPQVARNLHMGDYTNLSIDLELAVPAVPLPGVGDLCIPLGQLPELPTLPLPVGSPRELCEDAADLVEQCLATPTLQKCAAILDLIRDEVCAATPNNPVCGVAPSPVETLTDVEKCLQSNDPASEACASLDRKQLKRLAAACDERENRDNPVCRALLVTGGGGDGGGVGGVLNNLGRPAFGQSTETPPTRGPTMGQLMEHYDPALVTLLVPGMVTR